MLENTAVILAVYITTFIFGLPANILALYTFIKKVRRGATPVDVLLIGLTISDLLFLVFLPLWIKEAVDDMKWEMPDFLCPLSKLIFYGTIYNSTLYLTAISVERYLAVAFPITYKLNRKPCYAVIGSIIIWTISMAQCSIVYIMQYYHQDNNTTEVQDSTTCFNDFSSEQLEILLPFRLQLCVVLFCIPFLICSFCYINFIRILCCLPNISPERRHRAIGLALGTLLIFLACFGPHNVSHLVGYITGESPKWRKEAVLTGTFNACLDPFIYYFSSSALRGTFRSIFSRLLACPPQRCCPSRAYQGTAQRPAVELQQETRTQSTNDNLG